MDSPYKNRPVTKKRVSIIARKVAVTVAVGVFAYFLTEQYLDDDGPWAIMASVFLGGVAFVTQFLIDLERRMEHLERATTANRIQIGNHIDDRFKSINEATRLHDLVLTSDIEIQEMSRLVRSVVKADRDLPPLAAKLARSQRLQLHAFLDELARNGETSYRGEDRDWLLGLAQHVQASLKATSLTTVDLNGGGATDVGLWQTELGSRYLEAQARAVQRGVNVQRIFVIDIHGFELTKPFLDILRQHRECGVKVRVLVPTRNTSHDFIVFDNAVTYKTNPAVRMHINSAPFILGTRIGLRSDEVTELITEFDELWSSASEIDEFIAQHQAQSNP